MATLANEMSIKSGRGRANPGSTLALTAPFEWIGQGLADFRRIPGLSLLYGLLFAGLCAGIFYLTRNVPWYTVAYITGLAFVGPFLAAGLYAASRDMGRGAAPSISASLRLIGRRKTYLSLFALMLTLVMAAWVRLSALILAVAYNGLVPGIDLFDIAWLSGEGLVAAGYLATTGVLLGSVVFAISALAIPRILDRDADFVSAMGYSFNRVKENLPAMVIWAALITLLTAVGLATGFVGLTVIFPVLGYATWHSYRALTD